MRELQNLASPQIRRLLCVLFVRLGEMPTNPSAAKLLQSIAHTCNLAFRNPAASLSGLAARRHGSRCRHRLVRASIELQRHRIPLDMSQPLPKTLQRNFFGRLLQTLGFSRVVRLITRQSGRIARTPHFTGLARHCLMGSLRDLRRPVPQEVWSRTC